MFCILPPRLGNMLTDLQIEHINNKTQIITATYLGKNRSGDHVFQIKDPTMPAPTPEQMAVVFEV